METYDHEQAPSERFWSADTYTDATELVSDFSHVIGRAKELAQDEYELDTFLKASCERFLEVFNGDGEVVSEDTLRYIKSFVH